MNGPMFLYRPYFWLESLFSLAVIISCLVIYFKTKEMYVLTDHKGIRYFSTTFLFFAIAYFFRYFFRIFFSLFLVTHGLFRPYRPGFNFGLSIFVYASVMSALYLLYSLIYKKIKIKEHSVILIFNLFALSVTLINLASGSQISHIVILTTLFSVTALLSFMHKTRKKHPFFIAYILIFFAWVLNIISVEIPRFFIELRVLINIISTGLFLLILNRVLNKKNEQKKR